MAVLCSRLLISDASYALTIYRRALIFMFFLRIAANTPNLFSGQVVRDTPDPWI
ncbi:hypothetical protein N9A92_02555 [Pirellulales bacterium]|nr:hypothetical protein [Pirellulales bacterium]MDA7899389.1 hypothetical protein [Pirellulales bacterium]